MKVKIKATGEIVNIAEGATIALDMCDNYGDTIALAPEDVYFIQEEVEDEHWQNLRERAAIAAMQGLLANSRKTGSAKEYAEAAINYTDALIEELRKQENTQELAFAKGFKAGYEQYEQGYKDAFDKAYKWLSEQMFELYDCGEIYVADGIASSLEEFLNNFKKAMEK